MTIMQKALLVTWGFKRIENSEFKNTIVQSLPSHGGKGVSNVFLESVAMGRICIASTINGSKDVIDDGETGYLFETGNAKDLIDKVEKLLKLGYKEKKQMGLAGRKKV